MEKIRFAGCFFPMFASIARKPVVWKRVPPACAKVCPTESIVFGRLDDLRARATQRVQQLREHGYADAQLYDPIDTSVRGTHAFFLILGEPEAYGLPPKPQVPTIHLKSAWTAAFATAIGALIATLCAFAFL